MPKTIFLADDEKNIRDLMETFLANAGFAVRGFETGDALLSACETESPDLVILDIMMPGTDGLAVCSLLRQKKPALPLIIVSARDDPYDRVTGLSLGSDDYLVKPFLPLELVARVKALLRRTEAMKEPSSAEPEEMRCGSLTLSRQKRSATLFGAPLALTPSEFDFLYYLMRHRDRAISRDEVLREIWQFDWAADTRAADDLLKRLRKKLRDKGSDVMVETVWGFGFRLRVAGEEGDQP